MSKSKASVYRIDSFLKLHDIIAQYRKHKFWIFRGQADEQWPLLPKIGREPYSGVHEKQVFEAWKRRAVEYATLRVESDWDWLAIAQHHGLATRLLDWTINPLNAAFFAVREHRKGNAIVYAVSFKKTKMAQDTHPLDIDGIGVFWPRGVVPRITRQGGLFTIHGRPFSPMAQDAEELYDFHQIVIAEAYRKELLSELSFYGINAATLFPDLDGLSSFINWTIENREYWTYSAHK